MCSLADDRSLVIKKVDKCSCAVVWNRENYIAEAEKRDKNIYKKVNFKLKILQDLAETSNTIFKSLKRKVSLQEKDLNISQ